MQYKYIIGLCFPYPLKPSRICFFPLLKGACTSPTCQLLTFHSHFFLFKLIARQQKFGKPELFLSFFYYKNYQKCKGLPFILDQYDSAQVFCLQKSLLFFMLCLTQCERTHFHKSAMMKMRSGTWSVLPGLWGLTVCFKSFYILICL